MLKAIRTILADPIGRWVLSVLSLISIFSITIGFAIDPLAFLGNFLAEVAGMALSILLGLVLVEWFIEHQRKLQWVRSQAFTLRAIAVHLCEIAGSIFLHYPGISLGAVEKLFKGHLLPPNSQSLKSFDLLLQDLRNLPEREYKHKSTSDVAVEYYDAIRWDLEQIQNVLTLRVLQSPADQVLIDRLIEFDFAHRELRHAIIGHQQAVTHSVFPKVIDVIETAKKVYAAITEYWSSQDASAA
jgi:hypothetical protein